MTRFDQWWKSLFCVHRWKVDQLNSSKEFNTVILQCSVCFKTDVMAMYETQEEFNARRDEGLYP